MAGQIADLMAALQGKVDEIVTARADGERQEELKGILVDSISKTMREIKMGAKSEEFQELTVLNFVVSADDAGYSKDTISDFVQELKTVKQSRKPARP